MRKKILNRFHRFTWKYYVFPKSDFEAFRVRNPKRFMEEGKRISEKLYGEIHALFQPVESEEG